MKLIVLKFREYNSVSLTLSKFWIVLLLLIGDLEGLAGLVSCSRVNRIYFELFQDGLCNQTLGYLVILWCYSIMALLSLMLAMVLYRVWRLDFPLDAKLQEEDQEQTEKALPKGGEDGLVLS